MPVTYGRKPRSKTRKNSASPHTRSKSTEKRQISPDTRSNSRSTPSDCKEKRSISPKSAPNDKSRRSNEGQRSSKGRKSNEVGQLDDVNSTPEEVSSLIEKISEAEEFDLMLSQQFRDEEASAKQDPAYKETPKERKYIEKKGAKLIVVEDLEPVEDPNLVDNSSQLNVEVGAEGVECHGENIDNVEVQKDQEMADGQGKTGEVKGELQKHNEKEHSTRHRDKSEECSKAEPGKKEDKEDRNGKETEIPPVPNEPETPNIESVPSDTSRTSGSNQKPKDFTNFTKKYGRPEKDKPKKRTSKERKSSEMKEPKRKASELKLVRAYCGSSYNTNQVTY